MVGLDSVVGVESCDGGQGCGGVQGCDEGAGMSWGCKGVVGWRMRRSLSKAPWAYIDICSIIPP